MRVTVGDQVFDSRQVPVALVMDEKERRTFLMNYPKPEGENHLFVLFPGDVPLETLNEWLKAKVPDFKQPEMVRIQSTGKL